MELKKEFLSGKSKIHGVIHGENKDSSKLKEDQMNAELNKIKHKQCSDLNLNINHFTFFIIISLISLNSEFYFINRFYFYTLYY